MLQKIAEIIFIASRVLLLAVMGYTIGAAMAQCQAHADTRVPPQVLKVAVIDTGYTGPTEQLCSWSPALADDGPVHHGSNVTSIILRLGGYSTAYCVQVYRVFFNGVFSLSAYVAALTAARTASIVNISLEGTMYSEPEVGAIKQLLDQGTIVVAAAGNRGIQLTEHCTVYPACADSRVLVVGNSGSLTSNYGPTVDVAVDGEHVAGGGVVLSGTSQSAALVTGTIVHRWLSKKGVAK